MNDRPRVFVATMFSGEGDFQEMLRAIHTQQNVDVTHFVVGGYNELEAHNSLWTTWRKNRPGHDLFVKVDADTVLVRPTILAEIWTEFKKNPRVTGMQAPLHDYMTDGLINGLNATDTRVTFNDSMDDLYCDRHVDTGHDIVLRDGSGLPVSLVPIGRHCHLANDRQAFHYGVHRMMKGQRDTINRVHVAWSRDKDRIRAMVLIGAQLSHRFVQGHRFNYADIAFKASFEDATRYYDKFVGYLQLGKLDQIR